MADPNKEANRDELYWLFPVLLIVAILAITLVLRPGSCSPSAAGSGPVPEGAPVGQVSGAQAEKEIIIPSSDNTGVRTGEDLGNLFDNNEIYTAEEIPPGEDSYTESYEAGPGLKIVIRSDIEEEGNSDIYLIDEVGYEPVRLTYWDSVESFPAITSDGARVYFASDRDDDPNNPNPFTKNTEIYYIDMEIFYQDPEGYEPERLTFNNETDYGVSVNADGTRMVHMSATKDNPDNPVMILSDGEANNGQVIADQRLKNAVPKISGDGNYIVYNSFYDGEMDIYLYDVRREFTINLTNSDIPEYFPAINYDGSVIVYEKLLGGTPQAEEFIELYRIDPDGSNEVQLTLNRYADTFPAVTDDGEWIVFVTKRWDFDGDSHYDEALFYMDISGENTWKITKDPYYEEQPDV